MFFYNATINRTLASPLLLFIAVSRILRAPGDMDGGDGRGETSAGIPNMFM